MHLESFFAGEPTGFIDWVRQQTETLKRDFESLVRDHDLETVQTWLRLTQNRVLT
jgi:hypothetical protein